MTSLARSGNEIGDSIRAVPRRVTIPPAIWFALPAFLFVGVFFVAPLVLNIPLSFSNWTTYRTAIVWNGLANFNGLYRQGYLINAIWITVAYSVIAMLVQNVVSLSLAYALRESTLLNGLFRSLFFLPVLISPLAVGYIWRGILDPAGPIDSFISLFVPGGFHYSWLGNTSTALPAVAFVDAWKWIGLTTLVYIAGINSVPRELHEAARMDGASGWQTFWRITFPLLAPAFTFNIAVTLIGAFSAFDVIQATTGGGPGSSTRSINVLLRIQWGMGNFGTGSALGLIVTVMVIVVAIPLVAYLRRREVLSLREPRSWALARYAGLTLFAIPWIVVPIWMVLVNSFKQAGEAASLDLTLPSVWSFIDNYSTVLVQGNYVRALANSLLVSVPTIAAVVLIGAAAAWGFGRSRSKLMQFGYYVIALSILIPPSLIPTIYLLRDLNLDGTTLGYILVLVGTRMGVVVFLATGFVRATPTDIEDAACMDGANRLQIFFLIMLPLLAPVLFVGSVILLISVWGDFFFATFLLPGTARATLPLALYSFATSSVQSFRWNLVFAHVVLSSLPLVIAYVFIQRRVIGGLTEGALKG